MSLKSNGKRLRVRRTSSRRLRVVNFSMSGRDYEAIEQNSEKPSRWGQLARDGRHVVQFKDAETNRFVAVAVDGKVQVYGSAVRTRRRTYTDRASDRHLWTRS